MPVKSEGDLRSPAGVFSLGSLFGVAPRVDGASWPYRETTSDMICDDWPDSARYNTMYRSAQVLSECAQGVRPCPERLMRGNDHLYDLALWVNHNKDGGVKGGGSCIFLHIWRDESSPTAGCTAMERSTLLTIARWLKPERLPVLVQMPTSEYVQVSGDWGLPGLPAGVPSARR